MSKEESEIDLIKDFLKTKGFKSTLESLEKEESLKGSDKKKVSIIFIFYFPISRINQMINSQN